MSKGKRKYKIFGAEFSISEDRIAQVTNDVAESIHDTHTPAELRECVRYWSLYASLEGGRRVTQLSSILMQILGDRIEAHTLKKPKSVERVTDDLIKTIKRMQKSRL
jgi:hypothetical protein